LSVLQRDCIRCAMNCPLFDAPHAARALRGGQTVIRERHYGPRPVGPRGRRVSSRHGGRIPARAQADLGG
jgi:hypothetical protein